MRTLKIYQVDSFTAEKFKGNPAGVVLNADGLTDQEMLNIARELKSIGAKINPRRLSSQSLPWSDGTNQAASFYEAA